MPNIGPLEIVIVLVIVLIIFGPKRLPELGSSLGQSIREFRSSIRRHPELEAEDDEDAPAEKVDGEVVNENKD